MGIYVGCTCDQPYAHAPGCPLYTAPESPPDSCNFPLPTWPNGTGVGRIDWPAPDNSGILQEIQRRLSALEDNERAKPRPPPHPKLQRLLKQYGLLRQFAEHVKRVDTTRLHGTPLGVRAKEVLDMVDEIE